VTSTPQPATASSLFGFFGPGGLLSRTHPAYEFRRGQLQMAQAVEEALGQKRHLIVEAGTGTGKTLAYLLPVIRAGKRVVISTGTKNLQEQLFYKDVPFLERALYPDGQGKLRVCYMKGRNNYLCRKKLYDLADQPVLNGLEEIDQFRAIAEWDKTTDTGDRAELTVLPETSSVWPKLDARSETCLGQKCQQYERCFITEMHRRAVESDIIIVNHHLFFADLAIKREADGAPDAGVLPEFAAVVFDEAHELEDVASSYFGVSVSNLRFDDLARDIDVTLRQKNAHTPELMAATARLRERAGYFFSVLPPGEGRFAFANRAGFLEEHGDDYDSLVRAITQLYAALDRMQQKPEDVFAFLRRLEELRVQLQFVLQQEDKNVVFWIERRGTRGKMSSREFVFIQATPIDISQILSGVLFDQVESIVLTSATLAVNQGFQYIKQRLGVNGAREMVVPSHFNYESQAVLYVPPEMPEPNSQPFSRRAAEEIRRVLEITRGRAFCLFTNCPA
jgi:ATP-dependent DNA helicase DinG